MKQSSNEYNATQKRARLIGGIVCLVFAVAVPLFVWYMAGSRALITAIAPATLLLIFGILFLSGRWPNNLKK